MIDKLIWFFGNAQAFEIATQLMLPVVVGLVLYQSHYPFVLLRALWRRARASAPPVLRDEQRVPAALVVPSLLRNREELEGIVSALESAMRAGYPGALTVCASVDGRGGKSAPLYAELEAWAEARRAEAPGIEILVTGSERRRGKAMAVDEGVRAIAALAARGAIERPVVFFNMDADTELGEGALERLVCELWRPSRLTGQPGMIVTSHVAIPEQLSASAARKAHTVEGQIVLGVAREFAVAIGLGRYNHLRILPQLGASGALYTTWFELAHVAPRYARFVETLRWRDWLLWWIGEHPPAFRPERLEPLPEAMTGMGDDTWMSFLACSARWERGRPVLDLPRTPAHALWYALRAYLARPMRYAPDAKIYTSTPTSIRALFKQRVRWNISRVWTVQKFGLSHFFQMQLGIPAMIEIGLAIALQVALCAGLLLMPFSRAPAMWLPLMIVVELGYAGERTVSTLLALAIDGTLWKRRHLLLALPLSGIYFFTFHIATTLYGFFALVLGLGLNDGFAPEHTLERCGTGRPALAYRAKRALLLAWRSVRHGDVPLGWFWIGWDETPWTHSGYRGWTTGGAPSPVKPATPGPASPTPPLPAAPAIAASASTAEPLAEVIGEVIAFPVLAANGPELAGETALGSDDDVEVTTGVRRKRAAARRAASLVRRTGRATDEGQRAASRRSGRRVLRRARPRRR